MNLPELKANRREAFEKAFPFPAQNIREVPNDNSRIQSFLDETIDLVWKEAMKEKKELYKALELMWEQYCPEPFTHQYMQAGENAEEVLEKYDYLRSTDSK